MLRSAQLLLTAISTHTLLGLSSRTATRPVTASSRKPPSNTFDDPQLKRSSRACAASVHAQFESSSFVSGEKHVHSARATVTNTNRRVVRCIFADRSSAP